MPTYDILSPDGFSMHPSDTYRSLPAAIKAFNKWKERYKHQGYYSSTKFGRIALEHLELYCDMITLEKGQSLYEGKTQNLAEVIKSLNKSS